MAGWVNGPRTIENGFVRVCGFNQACWGTVTEVLSMGIMTALCVLR